MTDAIALYKSVVCPECRAAVTAKCTRPTKNGFECIETFHHSRVALAISKHNSEKGSNDSIGAS